MTDLQNVRVITYEMRRDQTARAMYEFFKGIMSDLEGAVATMDREKLLLYMDAFRSRTFMHLIEEDADIPYDIKVNVSQMVSGLNKTWPAVNRLIYDSAALRFAAVAWRMAQIADAVVDNLGIKVAMPGEFAEVQPEELPPGDGASNQSD